MSFQDQRESHHTCMDMTSDPTYGVADATMTDLDDFFARPIKIYSFSWNVGSGVLASPNPWNLYFNNPRVINRITNYRNIRCRLNVKIVLNGNGFHYGRLLASYLPYANSDVISKQGRAVTQDAIAESQRMHLYLDPTQSQGGTMTFPFFYHKNNLDVVNEDWDDMGDLIIRSLQPLAHANGATDSVTVSVFAWLTDVVLSGPTSTDSGALVPQAGEYSEYQTSPVSTVSSTVAAIANNLTGIPVIAPFAMATEMLANAVTGIARLFGFSRPNNISAIEQYKPMYCGNLANSDAPDTCQRLTMASKQELSIDPRTVGLPPVDELDIKHLAGKESYLTQFGWDIADAAETLLWNCRVTPSLFDTVGAGNSKESHMTAMCYATYPFSYWRGSIKFRFMVVASAFQKGRLRIVYDPWVKSGSEYNTNQSAIIDLAKERDFTIQIGWSNSRSYLRINHDIVGTLPFSTTAFTTPEEYFTNGVISVFVLNELTTPNSTVTNNAAVNVLVSAVDDLEVSVPSSVALRNLTIYEPQFGEYVNQAGHADDDHTQQQSAPEQSIVTDTMAAPQLSTDNSLKVFFGDIVPSLRNLTKRYCLSMYIPRTARLAAEMRAMFTILPNYPLDGGYAPDGIHQVTTPVNPTAYTYANMTFFNYVKHGFAGLRGSVRWKALHLSTFPINKLAVINYPELPAVGNIYSNGSYTTISDSNSLNAQADTMSVYGSDYPGAGAITTFDRNPVLEYEIPYYSYNRFSPIRTFHSNTGTNNDGFNNFHAIQQIVQSELAPPSPGMLGTEMYCAAGEDFMPCFYIGPPVFYKPATKPAPV